MTTHNIQVHKLHTGEDFSRRYADHRPVYPEKVFQAIISHHRQSDSCGFELALDVGCGTGQATLPLSKYFSKVIGVDVSEDQIANAPKDVDNVTFQVAPAEDLSFLQDGSVDLVTIATAIHWVDKDKFYSEVQRILKPGGSLVVYGYASEHLDHPQAEQYMQHLQHDVFGKYFTKHGLENQGGYKNIVLPFPGSTRREDLEMEADWTVDQFVGFQSSISFVCMYSEDNPDHDILKEMKNTLLAMLRDTDSPDQEIILKIRWPIFMLLGHKPN